MLKQFEGIHVSPFLGLLLFHVFFNTAIPFLDKWILNFGRLHLIYTKSRLAGTLHLLCLLIRLAFLPCPVAKLR